MSASILTWNIAGQWLWVICAGLGGGVLRAHVLLANESVGLVCVLVERARLLAHAVVEGGGVVTVAVLVVLAICTSGWGRGE